MTRVLRPAALAVLLLGSASAQAVTITGTYATNFDTLASTGTGATVPAGFSFTEAGTSATNDGLYTANDGSSNAGNTYSYGSTGATDRAFGTLLSGTLTSTLFGTFTNGGTAAISSLAVSYVGEMWRIGGTSRLDRLDFAYSLDGGTTYIDFDALDFASPFTITTGAPQTLDGNLAANRTLVTSTLSGLSLAVGSTITFRWSDFNAAGADDGLAIDDFSLTPTFAGTPAPAVPEPGTWAMMIGGFGLVGGALRRRGKAALAAA